MEGRRVAMKCTRRAGVLAAALALAAAAAAPPPSPEEFFGFRMGADKAVLEWAKAIEYFHALGKASDRIVVKEYGKSTEGRPMIVGIISAPETLRKLDRFQQIQRKLADPRTTGEDEAARLAGEGKAVVLITCSVHSTELASTQTAMEFAHRLVTSKDARVQTLLANVILLLAPTVNPDGLDLVARWYQKTLGTPYEGTSPPELYQKYIGHDNNRDWYIFSQAETRAIVSQLHNQWRPHIVYDVHQMGPSTARMFVPPWMDPIEPNIDPLIAQQCNSVGTQMATDLTAAGRKGVVVNAVYDFWTPARHYQCYHGGLRILSESASVRLASPITMKPEQISNLAAGYNPRERSWNHLEPWLGGEWRLRDIVDDQLIAMESVVRSAALRREELLRNFYAINKHQVERRSPYAFVLPAAQADPGAARKLLETLEFGDVEIEKAAEGFTANGKLYAAGTFVVRMQQPYSGFAKALLERQKYPDLRQYPGGPPKRPYDVTAQTLPLLMGVDVDTLEEPIEARLVRARDLGFPARGLSASDSDSWKKVNQAWRSGTPVWRHPQTGEFATGGRKAPGFVALKKPRVGLYKSFVPSMDEGWTRWILEQFGWDYASLGNTELKLGGLKEKFDVIVFADQSAGSIQNGYRPGAMPEEFSGGLGKEGAEALKQFLEAGGRLVFLNDSGEVRRGGTGRQGEERLEGGPEPRLLLPGLAADRHAGGGFAAWPGSAAGVHHLERGQPAVGAGRERRQGSAALLAGAGAGLRMAARGEVPRRQAGPAGRRRGAGPGDPVRHAPAVSGAELSEPETAVQRAHLLRSRTRMSRKRMWPLPPECNCRAMVPVRKGALGSVKSIISTPFRRAL